MAVLSSSPDATKVATALRALAADMNDPYQMPDDLLARALAADSTAAVLAEDAGTPVGVALYSLFPSTTRGQIGAFITDLWVHRNQRGNGLGQALLAQVRDDVAAHWGATFLRLNYYADNPDAARFYARLGFQAKPQEIWVTLEGAALQALT